MSSSAVYVVNLDEMPSVSLDGANLTANIDLSSVEALINQVLNEVKKPTGMQQAEGKMIDVPAITGDYEIEFIPTTDILLTGIVYSQTAYKSGDKWDLLVNGMPIFRSIYTKEMPEKKTFQKYYPVPQGNTVKIILHNVSGNSRQVHTDFEYISLIGG